MEAVPKLTNILLETELNGRKGFYLRSKEFMQGGVKFIVISSEITGRFINEVSHTIKNQKTGKLRVLTMEQLVKAAGRQQEVRSRK